MVVNQTLPKYDPEKTCFVISPIGEENTEIREQADSVLRHIIIPALRDVGLTAMRSDSISTPGIISSQIIQHIINDKMIVADLSSHNPNVFYELALRHAFRKPVVQIINAGEKIPFDVGGIRTVNYELSLDGVVKAAEKVRLQIEEALQSDFAAESPVSIAASLEELLKNAAPQTQLLLDAILNRVDNIDRAISFIKPPAEGTSEWMEVIRNSVGVHIQDILQHYQNEIDLLKSMRAAGVIGVFRQREAAMNAFSRYIDEENSEIVVIGSSLKGLLQKTEFMGVKEKLRIKMNTEQVKIKFLLTHPIVADFRAKQENRDSKEIGSDIILTLSILKDWGVPCENVRLYLGTPTYFAMKTQRYMLINPYSYGARGFESPCFILAYSPEGESSSSNYLFDQFKSLHFEAWDTELSVPITNYDTAINHYSSKLTDYAQSVEGILSHGKSSI